MIRTKLSKILMLSMFIMVMSASAAYASEVENQPLFDSGQEPAAKPEERPKSELIEVAPDYLDVPVSDELREPKVINEAMYQKQREVDSALFEKNRVAITEKDFVVTHTGSYDEYVEIGITPYSEENANFIYGLVGRDGIKVVEGQQAELLRISSEANDGIGVEVDMAITSADDADLAATTSINEEPSEKESSNSPWIYVVGGFIVLGLGYMVIKNKK